MKRTVCTIKQYDYTNKEEFLKDVEIMKTKKYYLIDKGMFDNCLQAQEIDDSKWKYTAYFIKSDMM